MYSNYQLYSPSKTKNKIIVIVIILFFAIVAVLLMNNTPSTTPSTTTPSTTTPSTTTPSIDCIGTWGSCSATCGGGKRTYTITTQKTGDGKDCEFANETSQDCNTQICPVDCIGSWGSCSVNCGGGKRTYTITTQKTGDGKDCEFANKTSQDCNTQVCPVDCIGSWGPCSEGCGPGIQYYIVTTHKQGTGISCEASPGSSRGCKIKDCAVTWPSYNANPFSIKLRNTNSCLHPNGGSHTPNYNTNLVLYEGCNEDRLRFKVFSDGQIQHYRPPNTVLGGSCLHPQSGNQAIAKDNDEIVFRNTCDDYWPNMAHTLRYTYENGKIKNTKSELCLKADGTGNNSTIRLKDCNSASLFDLVPS